MKSYKGLIISFLLLITIVSALAYPLKPFTRFDNVLVRGRLSLDTPTDNAYMPYGEGIAYLTASAATNGAITTNKTYQIVDTYANGATSTINFIATVNVHIGDIVILEGHPTRTITLTSCPSTVNYSVDVSGNQTGGLNSTTQNIMLNVTDWTIGTVSVNQTTYSVVLRNNRSFIGLIFNGQFWCELFRSLSK